MDESDQSLNRFIFKLNIIDSEFKINNKLIIVEKFEKVMENHVMVIYKKLNIVPIIPSDCCICKLLTHGSTELRISLNTSDVDVVLVLPNYISRIQWFNLIVEKLRENSDTVHDIVPIIDTFVPVIKLKYEELQFDMVISCLSKPAVPSNIDFNVGFNNLPLIYEGIDNISIRGLSSIYILHIIKSMIIRHQTIFIKFIRTIKIWTSKREMDFYIYGFPSAIAWVIMALYIYKQTLSQKSGKITVYSLLRNFFSTFMTWKWPEPVEIKSKTIDCCTLMSKFHFQSFSCERHIMPIISLVYPFKNTAFTVRPSSLGVIIGEFKRAYDIIQNCGDYKQKWEQLFQQLDISNEYRHFVHIKFVCTGDNFIGFQGLIASKLRDYASHLENIENVLLARIHAVGKPDNCQCDYDGKRSYSWIIGLRLHENVLFKRDGVRTAIDITDATLCFYHILNEKSPYNKFQKMLNITYVRGKNILNIINM